MTLVVTVNGPESIWLLADRRLTTKGRPTKDDARKIMILETTDAVAIIGYTGLGASALGTEPSDWMSAVLRGRNLPLEQSLGVLADAMKKQFPPHMARMPVGQQEHSFVIPAFLGNELRLYSIDLAFTPDRKGYFRYTRHIIDKPPGTPVRTPRVAMGGSGALYLINNRKKWDQDKRFLLRLIRANDRGRLSSLAVADRMARLNYEVSQNISNKTVGPRCTVVWRYRKGGVHKVGGGQQFYNGSTRDTETSSLPTIARGMDLDAICDVIMPHMTKRLTKMLAGEPAAALDTDLINAELARLPENPDEKLR